MSRVLRLISIEQTPILRAIFCLSPHCIGSDLVLQMTSPNELYTLIHRLQPNQGSIPTAWRKRKVCPSSDPYSAIYWPPIPQPSRGNKSGDRKVIWLYPYIPQYPQGFTLVCFFK